MKFYITYKAMTKCTHFQDGKTKENAMEKFQALFKPEDNLEVIELEQIE